MGSEVRVSSEIKKRVRIAIPFPMLKGRYLPVVLEEGIVPEIGLDHQALDLFSPEDFQEAARMLQEAGIRPTVHAPFCDLSPGAFDREVRRASLKRLKEALEIARLFAPEVVVFHSGYHPGYHRERQEAWQELFRPGLRELVALAENLGLKLALENVFEPSPSLLTTLVEEMNSPALGYCFDAGHALAFAKSEWVPWLEAFKGRLFEIHVHDNDGTWDDHLVPGQGKIPFPEIFSFLEAEGLAPVITYEAHREEDVLPGLVYLERILQEK